MLNGILYRALHPNQAFVIYIRYDDVVLQYTNHPNNISNDLRLMPIAPANQPKPGPRRKLRDDQQHGHHQLPGCNAPLTQFDLVTIDQLSIEIGEANNIIKYLGLSSMKTKLIKINYLQQEDIRLEEQLKAMNDLFNIFTWTMEGYFTSRYYHLMYEPVHKEMSKMNSMYQQVGLDVKKKLLVTQYLRGRSINELQKDIKWCYHPSGVITDTIKILKLAFAKLLLKISINSNSIQYSQNRYQFAMII